MTNEKLKYELGFLVKASPSMFFPFLSTPTGLSQWFSDEVNSRDEQFTFIWNGDKRTAIMIGKKVDKYIRFCWKEDAEEGNKYFFEFRIVIDELTHDVSLIIVDYCDKDEVEEEKLLWKTQVNRLLRITGSGS